MNYYEEIKQELINNETYRKVKDYSKNRSDLMTCYNVGKLLIEAQGGESRSKYGEHLIKEYSIKLMKEIGEKYNTTLLKRMRQFYLMIQKGATMSHQLTQSHYFELLSIKDINEMNYYINLTEQQNLTIRGLRDRIKSKEYERLDDKTKMKLINKEDITLPDIIKNPIIIGNPNNINVNKEKVLKLLILENIDNFLKELGEGFSYIGNEYPIKIGNSYNYIDILLYNIKFNSYVVVELKITELKKEYIGQIQVYMNYIDENIKTINQDKTIGIIICRENNEFIIKYASDDRILSREYILN
ncbi:MAG: DUF1016 family protein [Bacilli bacterium]|nr:DUF1016 family protein [Bacilli bacterium]